jgi:hypothetical protein
MKKFLIFLLFSSLAFGEGNEVLKIGTQTHNVLQPLGINWPGTTLDFTGSTVDFTGATVTGLSTVGAFTDLTDVPNSYSGQSLKIVRVNTGETGLEFATISTGGVTSVDVSGANGISSTGGPITTSGTIALSLPITLAGTAGKTLTVNNTLTFTGTDGSTLNIGAGGTLGTAAYTASSAYQPIDSDLTAIAALATDSFGRDLLIKTSGADVRSYIGAGTSSFDGTFTSLTSKPTTLTGYGITDAQPLDSDLTTIAGLTATTDNFLVSVSSAWASRTPTQVRTTLGLVIGTNVQAWDTQLDSLAGLSYTGNTLKVVRVNAAETGFELATASGGGTPGGSDTQVQFNDSSAFGGDTAFTWDKTANILTLGVAGSIVGELDLKNATSGTIALKPPTGALGTVTVTVPAATDTLVGKATTDTLTNKRITKRIQSMGDATSFTPDSDSYDISSQTNTQALGTLTANAPTGTPTDGQSLMIRIKSTNVQTFSWNAAYSGGSNGLPTATTGGSTVDMYAFMYSTLTTTWLYTGGVGGF